MKKIRNLKFRILNYFWKKKLKRKKVLIGNNVLIYGNIYCYNLGKIKIGNNVILRSGIKANPVGGHDKLVFFTDINSELIIGNGVGISNAVLSCLKKIVIEDNVFIGGGVQIYDSDHHSLDVKDRLNGDTNILKEEVLIKEGAFIGASSIILKGVTIGKNSVIGAGSIVTKSVPDNEIWAGNPAKFIKKI